MNKILKVVAACVVLLGVWGVASVFAQSGTGRPFITKWQGTKGEELKIPIVGKEYQLVIKDESNKPVKDQKVTVTEGDALYYTFTPERRVPKGWSTCRCEDRTMVSLSPRLPVTINCSRSCGSARSHGRVPIGCSTGVQI